MKKFMIWTSIGITPDTDEDAKKRIVLVNQLGIAIALLILIIAPPICIILKWPALVTVAVVLDILANGFVLLLNHIKKYRAASLTLYLGQCAAILYFGCLLGEPFHLQFMLMFLISIIFLVFEERSMQKVCLLAAMAAFLILEGFYYFSTYRLVRIESGASFLIQFSVASGVLALMAVVNIRYFKSNVDNLRLIRANNFIRIFVAQVTHELRTPLDSIHQVSQLLKKEIKQDRNLNKIGSLVDIGFTASSHASNIVNNVLDMAEIEGGKMPAISAEPFRLIPLMEKVLEVNQVIASRNGMKLRLQVDENMPEVIIGDPMNINQVLTNLLANAIKYGAKKSAIRVGIMRMDPVWQLQVSNYGPMIPQDKIDSIFDPFFTGRTGQIQGAGLGLYIVRNKVTLMNGNVHVESNPDGLTVFTVTIPLTETTLGDQPTESATEAEVSDINSVNILVAEDSRLTAFLLSRFLTEMGCTITMVNNGQELLDMAKQKCPGDCPDIIIMDYNMPVLNGEETILEIKRTPHLRHIPIIVTTGDVSTDTVNRLLAAGADAYLKKPIDHLILQKKINQFIGNYH